MDGIDQDQTAQNDLGSCSPLVKSNFVIKFFVGLSKSYLQCLEEVGFTYLALKALKWQQSPLQTNKYVRIKKWFT